VGYNSSGGGQLCKLNDMRDEQTIAWSISSQRHTLASRTLVPDNGFINFKVNFKGRNKEECHGCRIGVFDCDIGLHVQTSYNRSFWSQLTGQNEWMVLTT